MQYGLLGRKLSHSYSPQIHKYLGDYSYNLFEIEPEALGTFLQRDDIFGLNVTMPYKKAVIPYCHQLTESAHKLGAVNTLIRCGNQFIGHNSDYFGFQSLVKRSCLLVADKKVLILGSGGASATAACVMQELGARVVVISRTGENNYTNLYLHADASVIVNTTPVGMYPETGFSAVDLSVFPSLEGVLDVIYNPSQTKFLMDAAERGLIAENGLWMLVAQAKESAEWFTGTQIDDAVIEQIYRKLRMETENTVLIGMPGSGKSTVGKLLSNMLGKRFLDTDSIIEEEAGKSIPEIFSLYGEDHFRALESEIIARIGKESGCVIATGGGCVTQPHNKAQLRQNGTIYWLKRNLDLLSTEGRPLSQIISIEEMYNARELLYQTFADCIIDNNHSPQKAAEAIFDLEVNR